MRRLVEALKEELSADAVENALRSGDRISVDSLFAKQLDDDAFANGMGDMVDGLRELGMTSDADKLEAALGEVYALKAEFSQAVWKQAKVAHAIAQKFEKKAKSTWR